MKKILISILTAILLITGTYLPVFCDENEVFVPSITVREDVELVSDPIIEEPDECVYELVVTPYIYRDRIESQESRELLEIAYESIIAVDNVAELNESDITEVAHRMGAETEDLVVRDLFDVTMYNREKGVNHSQAVHVRNVQFTVETQDLSNFVCLLVYAKGKWTVVDDVSVLKDRNLLNVYTEELSPFALIVASDYRYTGHAFGCIWHLYIIITMLITYVLTNLIRKNDKKTKESKKRYILIRDLICLISLILSIIFYIFGTCKYDVYALIADILIVTITFIYSHPHINSNEDEY